MNFNITGKHIDITDSLKDHVRNKTSKLPKYYNNINEIEVVIDGDVGRSKRVDMNVEIIARAKNKKVFVVKETGDDAYLAVDGAVKKLERQLTKQKEKERNNKHIH